MSRRTRPAAALALTALLLLASLTTATASTNTFTDVPIGHPFREEIGAIAGAGIAAGYPDGRYRPAAPLTRQAMAAFLARGLGRAAYASGGTTGSGTSERTVTSLAIAHGASGYLVIQAATTGSVATDYLCPCLMESRLVAGTRQSPRTSDQLAGEEQPGGTVVGSTANTWLLPVHGEGSTTVTLLARRANATTGNPSATFTGTLTAQYVPFDATGHFNG
jgi:hypothetical protein